MLSATELLLILRLVDLALFGLAQLPVRDAAREAVLRRLRELVDTGQAPSPEDFDAAVAALDAAAAERDNIVAMKAAEES